MTNGGLSERLTLYRVFSCVGGARNTHNLQAQPPEHDKHDSEQYLLWVKIEPATDSARQTFTRFSLASNILLLGIGLFLHVEER